MNIFAIGKTDTGIIRKQNEDSFLIANESDLEVSGKMKNLYVVADGMGGHNAGEIASKASIEKFCDYVYNVKVDDDDILDFLVDATLFSNKEVYKIAINNKSYQGMGTTFTCATIVDKKLYAVHIGDSRLYRISKGRIKQLSIDHTFVNEMIKAGQITQEEARYHPNRNLVTRALGVDDSVNIDAFLCNLDEGDKVLICSDGLTGLVTDSEILEIVTTNKTDTAVDILINNANNNGGNDNITVILIDIAR